MAELLTALRHFRDRVDEQGGAEESSPTAFAQTSSRSARDAPTGADWRR